jgi:hypothetical protein
MTDDETDAFEPTLRTALLETYDLEEALASEAASKADRFREEFDEDLTAERVLELLSDAPYEAFEHRFDAAIGELAADNEDCTDSRAYRLGGYGEMAADPSIGT